MASINNFTIVGTVTKDVELRYTPSGTATVTYSVAIDNVWYDNNGAKKEECDFIPVTTYGKQAENDAKFLKKGSPVAVSGRIHSWYKREENKGGFNFEAERVQYLGKPSGNRSSDAPADTCSPADDDWVRSYDRTETAGTPATKPAQRTTRK